MSSRDMKTKPATNDLPARLRTVGLCAVPGMLSDFIARATQARWSPVQVLEGLAEIELQERAKRGLVARLCVGDHERIPGAARRQGGVRDVV